ncbi:cysteine-rich receptor-like protein kinase 8 [Tanacetum coccineum]
MVTSSSETLNTTTFLQDDINSPHHPLYFYPNDHLVLLLIAKKLNRSDNYGTWKRSMLIALNAKNKLKLINGEYKEPPITSPLRAYWERANDMLISWILKIVSEQIGNHITFVNSASALWSELQEHYLQFDGLWDELDAIEAPYACTYDCYTNRRGLILLMQPLPLVAKAYNMLIQEEKQRDAPKHQPITTPIAVNTFRNTHIPSQRNNNPNTFMTNTLAERRSTFRKGIFYAYCKKEGHSKDECYKLLGYPPGHPLHKKYQPPSQRGRSAYKGGRIVNMVVGDTLPPIDTSSQHFTLLDQCSTLNSSSTTEAQNPQTELSGIAPHVAGHDESSTFSTLHGGLYLLPLTTTSTPPSSTVLASISNSHLWHTRLGHTPISTIKKI